MKEIKKESDSVDPILQYMYELIDVCTQGICFEIHRSIRLGYWEFENTESEDQKEFAIVDEHGLDIFGQQPVKKQVECICPSCSRTLAANRFAPHLEKCMGMGRNSSRIASRRIQTSGGNIEDYDIENDLDLDWNYECGKRNRKGRKDKVTSSPKRQKLKKDSVIGLSSLVNSNGGSRPGTPCSTASGDVITSIKAGPTLQALETLSRGKKCIRLTVEIILNYRIRHSCNNFIHLEEKVALLRQTCGAISEHTGKMCTRTGRCVQHSDEQRRSVRELLLGENEEAVWQNCVRPEGSTLDQDDIHVDVDGYEDMEGGSLLRLTPLPWDHDSNVSTGSDTMSGPPIPPSPVLSKTKKSKGRKGRSR